MAKKSPSRSPVSNTPKWTPMVYMAAGDSHQLDTVAVRDLKEMELGCKGNPNVTVVVQIARHWPNAAQRYEITSTGTRLIPPVTPIQTTNTNMGDKER